MLYFLHTVLIYCVVRISNYVGLIRSAVTHWTDAANDCSDKTNDNRNLHSTLIYLFFLFNLFVKY